MAVPNNKILFTEEQIRKRAGEIGAQIDKDYEGESIYLVGTLRGAVVWMADIMKSISLDVEVDFVAASSYAGTNTTGVVTIKKDVDGNVEGKNVIIVEDIVDTGTTLLKLMEYFKARGAKSVEICSMLNKPSRRTADVEPKYCGFDIDNLFVIGYGLDFDQKYRNLPYIGYIEG